MNATLAVFHLQFTPASYRACAGHRRKENEMRSRLTKLGAGLAALAALAAGGSALASAGHKTHAAKPPMSQSLTSLPAVSKGTEPAPSEPDADTVQQGDQSAPDTVALRALDLRIEPREIVALFGPSGSGKSTALHLAAGLDEPSAGEVRVFGRSLARLDERELAAYRAREVAIVFQSANLWPMLSAHATVALSLRFAGRPRLE